MDEMAVHGNGTFDHDKKQWKLRTKELKLSATTQQLQEMFKEGIPDSEKGSRPFWLKYPSRPANRILHALLGYSRIPWLGACALGRLEPGGHGHARTWTRSGQGAVLAHDGAA